MVALYNALDVGARKQLTYPEMLAGLFDVEVARGRGLTVSRMWDLGGD